MFFQPHLMADALEIRSEWGREVTPIGGGTDVVVALNQQSEGPKHLLDLSHIEGYSDVGDEDGRWVLGGGATFGRIAAAFSEDRRGGPRPVRALHEAAMTVGGAAIRSRATLAGNLATASPAGDGCVVLLALDAEVTLRHATRGARVVPIDEYFTGFRRTVLMADELIASIRFGGDWATAWYKIGKRGATNISIVCCAVAMSPARVVRISFGSVAPTVIRAKKAEAIVSAGGLGDGVIEAAAASAMDEVSPIDDHRASAAYRRAMCGVLARRLLRQLRAGEKPIGQVGDSARG